MKQAPGKAENGSGNGRPGPPVEVMVETNTDGNRDNHLHADLPDRHEVTEFLGIPRVISTNHGAATNGLALRWYSQTHAGKVNHDPCIFSRSRRSEEAPPAAAHLKPPKRLSVLRISRKFYQVSTKPVVPKRNIG